MMKSNIHNYKVAIVTESLWGMAGANRVLESFCEIFPNADIYSLFGKKENLSGKIQKHNIYFSFLNKIPGIGSVYRYTFSFWPVGVEQFDLSRYDLVISNSCSVAHGAITSLNCKHIAYVNSPMRYVWDLTFLYSKLVKFGPLKRCIKEFGLTVNRVWDVVAAQRADIIITNSDFVKRRVEKYWGRSVDSVIYPPVELYKGKTVLKRDNYFVSCAPFEPNKRGDFLMDCASKLSFNVKVIGNGSMRKKLERKYRKFKNIEFLGWISDEEKWKLLSRAKGCIVSGIEDYGIFTAESLSCGTPILAYKQGGSLEIVRERENGMFFENWGIDEFKKVLRDFNGFKWNYGKVRNSLINVNSREDFKKKVIKVLVE